MRKILFRGFHPCDGENGLKVPNFDKEEDYFFVNAVENQVRRLVDVELAAANERFPQFHSQHEGFAVIMEEVDECDEALELIKKNLKTEWESIRADKKVDMTWVFSFAWKLACEAIQVAAMCKKFLEMEGNQ